MLSNLRSVLGTSAEVLRKRQLQNPCSEPAPKQSCTATAASTQEEDSESSQSFLPHTPSQSLRSASLQPLDGTSPDVQVTIVM